MAGSILSFGRSFVAARVSDGLYGASMYVYSWFRPNIIIRNDIELNEITPREINNKESSLVPFLPTVSLKFPSASEIGCRVLTSVAVDVPMYTIKCLYNSPVPTAIALYMVLPTEVSIMIIQYMGYAILKVYK